MTTSGSLSVTAPYRALPSGPDGGGADLVAGKRAMTRAPARMGRVRYIIIGAGAVGGTIGGCLFQAGHDVVLVARGAHLDALRTRGLRLATPAGTSTLGIPAAGGPAEVRLRPGDTLILTSKTQDAAALLEEWAWQPVSGGASTVAADTLPVVCAQNGVASERFALRRFRHVYGMHVWLPATHLEPGEVVAQGTPLAGLLHIGRYPAGTDATSERIAQDLGKSRFLAPVSPDVMRWKYGKLLDNLNNAIEALCGRGAAGFSGAANPGGEGSAELRRLVRAEGTAVLDIAGFDYSSAADLAGVRRDRIRIEPVDGSARAGGSSWQSLIRQTGTIEASFLNGEIVLLGRQYDVPTPVNETLQRLANQAARERKPPGSMTPAQVLAAAGVTP
jgi:2-dehydropantoate 2-reductase